MNNFQRLNEIRKVTKKMDPRRRKYKYLKFLRKYILLNFFDSELVIVIPKQESSVYFRDVYGSKWRAEYEKVNGVRYKDVYSHFSVEIFEEVLKILDYSIVQKKEKVDKWMYCINLK